VSIFAVDASPQKAIGYVIILLAILGLIGYLFLENRVKPKDNVANMLDAPNRKAPPADDVFEGPRLDRFLTVALVGICLTALSLPLYWLGEPTRQEGAIRGFDKRSVKRGERAYGVEIFGCVNCHGAAGVGGVAPWFAPEYGPDGRPILDAEGAAVANAVSWKAPAINQLALKYRKGQIRQVLYFGRGGNKPMPAWHVSGGGPGTDQQIDDVIHYLMHLALEGNDEAREAYSQAWKTNGNSADDAYQTAFLVAGEQRRQQSQADLDQYKKDAQAAVTRLEGLIASTGQAAIDKAKADLAETPNDAAKQKAVEAAEKALADAPAQLAEAKANVAKGDGEILFEQHCARCHTPGFSFGKPRGAGTGWYGPALDSVSLIRQFPRKEDQHEFIKNGVDNNRAYGTGGVNGWDGGGMPYFANFLTDEMIDKIVDYERNLEPTGTSQGANA
jgi:mono/diheme cytochrome c family protein